MPKGKKEGSINQKLNLCIKSGETLRGKLTFLNIFLLLLSEYAIA